MLDFLRAMKRDRTVLTRLPSMVLALGVAEVFYKFHSFALECAGFLATWLVFDLVVDFATGRRTRRDPAWSKQQV